MLGATDLGLITGTAALGLAGLPHCAAMCSSPCAAVLQGAGGGARESAHFHAGRVAGYAAAGALAAGGWGALQWLAGATPALRPAWTLLHLAALALGAWLLWQGRQPAWMGSWRAPRWHGGRRVSSAAGLAWVAWPCALLQSALVMAALTSDPAAGALAMAAFALMSAPGLQLAPWVLARIGSGRALAAPWAVRLAGAALMAGAAMAVGHDLAARVAVWCRGLVPGA
jgi:hypothetical protein